MKIEDWFLLLEELSESINKDCQLERLYIPPPAPPTPIDKKDLKDENLNQQRVIILDI